MTIRGHADEHDPGCRDRRRAVRRGRVGLGDRADVVDADAAVQPAASRTPVPAGVRRRRDQRHRARSRAPPAARCSCCRWSACSCSPPGSSRSASAPADQPGDDAGRVGSDRARRSARPSRRRCSSPASRSPPANLQRVFAIVELLRAVAAFMIAPVFAHFAATVGSSRTAASAIALWIGAGLAVGGAVIAVSLYVIRGARPAAPDIELFLSGEGAAWYSPPLYLRRARARPRSERARRRRAARGRRPGAAETRAAGGASPRQHAWARASGPIVIAYDGSELAELAIAEAGELLRTDRPVLVVCAWQPFDVGFVPADDFHVDAKQVPGGQRRGAGHRRARGEAGHARRASPTSAAWRSRLRRSGRGSCRSPRTTTRQRS